LAALQALAGGDTGWKGDAFSNLSSIQYLGSRIPLP